MNPEDINREIEALWERVHKSDVPPPQEVVGIPSPALRAPSGSTPLTTGPGSAGRGEVGEFEQQTAAETARLLRRQQRENEAYFREMLVVKDREIEAFKERLRELEARSEALRRESSEHESETMALTVQAQAWAEEQSRAFASIKEAHRQELEALQAAAEELREKLKLESAARARQAAEAKRKEEDLAARVRELEELPAKLRAELRKTEAGLAQSTSEAEAAAKRAEATLAELQEAVRKSTEELLRERGVRKEAEEAKARGDSELALLKETHERMKAAWAEERRQWNELWERERSTWETQRQEMRQWEEDLRRQRDEWVEKLRQQGPSSPHPTLSPLLRGEEARRAGEGKEVSLAEVLLPYLRWVGVGLAALLIVGGTVWGLRRLARGVYLRLEASSPVPLESPTALAWDGVHLWAGSWSGRLAVLDPANPAKPLWQSAPRGLGPFRPGGLAVGDGALWSLDAAQVRVLKHDPRNPGRLLWKSRDGSLPTAIAHDGRRLWVFEGTERQLYRYRGDPKLGPEDSFRLAPGLVATSMQWNGRDLWLFDSLNAELWRYRFDGARFALASRRKLAPGTAAVAVSDRQVWTLAVAGEGALLQRFRRLYP